MVEKFSLYDFIANLIPGAVFLHPKFALQVLRGVPGDIWLDRYSESFADQGKDALLVRIRESRVVRK